MEAVMTCFEPDEKISTLFNTLNKPCDAPFTQHELYVVYVLSRGKYGLSPDEDTARTIRKMVRAMPAHFINWSLRNPELGSAVASYLAGNLMDRVVLAQERGSFQMVVDE